MTQLTKEYPATSSVEQLSPQMLDHFSTAEELIRDIQDSPAFAEALETSGIPFDDTSSDYWEAVRSVTERSIKLGEYVDNKPLLLAVRIAAATPDAAYKQFYLDNAKEYDLDAATCYNFKYELSIFNDRLRDYVIENLDTPFQALSLLLTESASKGIDRSLIEPVAASMQVRLKGIRTEIGLEQKAATAGLAFRRGTTEEDLKGIDYVIDAVKVDVKSSLHDMVAASHNSLPDKAYFIHVDKATIFPYDYPTDYEGNGFRIKADVLQERSDQLAKDINEIKKILLN